MKALAGLVLLAGCATEPNVFVELGQLDYYQEPVLIDAPATAAVGVEIRVTVRTYGGGCTTYERTEVEERAGDMVILPFDRRERPEGGLCTDELRRLSHAATFTFTTAGARTIHVQGRRVAHGVDEPIEIPVPISVR